MDAKVNEKNLDNISDNLSIMDRVKNWILSVIGPSDPSEIIKELGKKRQEIEDIFQKTKKQK